MTVVVTVLDVAYVVVAVMVNVNVCPLSIGLCFRRNAPNDSRVSPAMISNTRPE